MVSNVSTVAVGKIGTRACKYIAMITQSIWYVLCVERELAMDSNVSIVVEGKTETWACKYAAISDS